MDMIIIFTYKQLLAVVFIAMVVLLVGTFFLIRLWAKNRFEKLDERTTSLEYSRDVELYSDAKEDVKDEANHG